MNEKASWLEESWNNYKKKLVSEAYEDRLHFQAGFNAAAKLFRKSSITSGQKQPSGYELSSACSGCSSTSGICDCFCR